MVLNLLLLFGYMIVYLSSNFVNGSTTQTSACYHNGTIYADKSFVPTTEPCLSCKCNKKTVICSLKVCPEMPVPPPRGCIVVQKKTSCCPYLSCARLDTFYNEPKRKLIAYLDHFERESIDRVVNENMLQRRSDDSDMDTFDEICVKNGTVYKSGSAMSSSSLCTYCYCIGGTQKCIKPKCMLPLDGCKPIFVDSTCCPVRYDCTAKSTGKSSQPNRLRKTSNKHYQRMSQRIQRNRGCIMNDHFYPEGQKMSADPDKPCDICFCIRGSRKCAPKKCSPALKNWLINVNCIPVVPKGQCCPSSYDCGVYKETNRSIKSRQFNLFSYIFGPDDGENITTTTRNDENVGAIDMDKTTTTPNEKGFFDTIRESLEFIDKNGNRVGTMLETINTNKTNTEHPLKNTISEKEDQIKEEEKQNEPSFLDLLLATSPKPAKVNETNESSTKTNDNLTLDDQETDLLFDEISLSDLILGKDENDNSTNDNYTTATEYNFASEEFSGDGFFDSETTSTEDWSNETTDYTTINEKYNEDFITKHSENEDMVEVINYVMSTTEDPVLYTTNEPVKAFADESTIINIKTSTIDELPETTNQNFIEQTLTTEILNETTTKVVDLERTSLPPTTVSTIESTPNMESDDESSMTETSKIKQQNMILEHKSGATDKIENQNMTSTMNIEDDSSGGFLSAFLDGLSDILENNNSSLSHFITNKVKNKTLEVGNLNVTVNETAKSNNTKLMTTEAMVENVTQGSVDVLTPIVTEKSVIVKTNPTILEVDLPLDYNEATLPPSLPNLKIIPFLPADAVKTDRKQIVYDFYKPTQFPSITERHTEWKNPHSKMDFDIYDKDEPHFDSITENYSDFNYEGFVDNDDQYDDYSPNKFRNDNSEKDSYVKFDYVVKKNGFLPPIKTEGGFMPKQPIDEQKLYEKYPATKFVIDITSASPIIKPEINSTIIANPGNTNLNPFKDVIKTEPPPDLNLLIEDKEKLMGNGISSEYYSEPNGVEDEIIHITTDATYNFTSEYSSAHVPEMVVHNKTNLVINSPEINMQNVTTSSVPLISNNFSTLDHIKPNEDYDAEDFDLGSVFDFLLGGTKKINNISKKNDAIPPFKALPSITVIPEVTTAPTEKTTTIVSPQTVKQKIGFIKEIMHSEPKSPDLPNYRPIAYTHKLSAKPISTTHNPFLSAPFNKLPFLDHSVPIKQSDEISNQIRYTPLKPDLDLIMPQVSPYNVGSYQVLQEDSTITNTESYVINPVNIDKLKQHQSEGTAEIFTKPHSSNSLMDPAGILKLAGCNIYGRMYRVGRIISELSGPCLECKCTEMGVNCAPLDC